MFSIVTPNRNRLHYLQAALPSWQRIKSVSEIVVTDYGSDVPIKPSDFASADKLKIVRVEGTDDWRIGHASNIGIDHATNDCICKLDSDIVVESSDWLGGLDLAEAFYRGHFQTSVPNGETLFLKKHWARVGGYNEWLSGYGFDDTDFYMRLRRLGLRERYIPRSFLKTIEHGLDVRADYKSTYEIAQLKHDDHGGKLVYDQIKNTFLCFMHRWSKALRVPYSVVSEAGNVVTIKTESIKSRYANEDMICQLLGALGMYAEDRTRSAINQLQAWLISQAGGFGERPGEDIAAEPASNEDRAEQSAGEAKATSDHAPSEASDRAPELVSVDEPPRRKNLVIVRAGDTSLHEQWIDAAGERNWDMIVNYFGDDPDRFQSTEIPCVRSKSTKWPALQQLLMDLGAEVSRYEYVWFPDDDLSCTQTDINRLFDICRQYRLHLAQPALTPDSHFSHVLTLRNRSFTLRYSNFVEIMAPCFSIDFLQKAWPTFGEIQSGWGLDSLWPLLLPDWKSIAIVDAVEVRHTRPVGGPNYSFLAERGINAYDEMKALCEKYKISPVVPLTRGAVDLNGRVLSIYDRSSPELLRRLIEGYLPELSNPQALLAAISPQMQYLRPIEADDRPDGEALGQRPRPRDARAAAS